MTKKCCPACFGDRGLRKQIIPFRSIGKGQCSYCRTADVELVQPADLEAYFDLVTAIYRPSKDGKSLTEWLRQDWSLFPLLDEAHAKELLADILDDGDVVRDIFEPSDTCKTDRLARWSKFREELMRQNRFFPDTELDLDRLGALLSHLIADNDELPPCWYRARLQESGTPFTPAEMSAPPPERAAHGRANPAGIPYLYLGSQPDTAIAELRPHTAEFASVAIFEIPRSLKIVDLRNPRQLISPFLLTSEEEVAFLRGDIDFLEDLGNELTRPVLPQGAAIDYLPSQYLCEFVKKAGYHGVLYRSSVSDGVNLALFEPRLANIVGAIRKYSVKKVSVTVEAVP